MIKVGILSCAHMHAGGYAHGLQLLPNVELVGIADENKERGEKFAQHFNIKYIPSYEELIQKVDAVVITSENSKHKALTLMAAEQKKMFFARNRFGIRGRCPGYVDACKQNGVNFMKPHFPAGFHLLLKESNRS